MDESITNVKVPSGFRAFHFAVFHGSHPQSRIITKPTSSNERKYLQIWRIKGHDQNKKLQRVANVYEKMVCLFKEDYLHAYTLVLLKLQDKNE